MVPLILGDPHFLKAKVQVAKTESPKAARSGSGAFGFGVGVQLGFRVQGLTV